MTEGDVLIARIPQSDGSIKSRPALFLREMPPFGDLLICGISTQLQQEVAGFDQCISAGDPEFARTGLKADSLIRLGFLVSLPRRAVMGVIGSIDGERLERLRRRLADYLNKEDAPTPGSP